MADQIPENIKISFYRQTEIPEDVGPDNYQFLGNNILIAGGGISYTFYDDPEDNSLQRYDHSSECKLIYKVDDSRKIALQCKKGSKFSSWENLVSPTFVLPWLDPDDEAEDKFAVSIDTKKNQIVLSKFLWDNYRLPSQEDLDELNIKYPPEECPPDGNCVECAYDKEACVPPMKLKSSEDDFNWSEEYFRCHQTSDE